MSEAGATVRISCAREFDDGGSIVISDSPGVSVGIYRSIMHTFTDSDTRSAVLMVASLAETNRRLRADLDDRLAAVVRAERLADSYRRERDEARKGVAWDESTTTFGHVGENEPVYRISGVYLADIMKKIETLEGKNSSLETQLYWNQKETDRLLCRNEDLAHQSRVLKSKLYSV